MDLQALLADKILVGDGATGTELMRLGAPPGVPSDLLNLEHPDIVAQVHRSYAEAGSDLVIANTFGATSIKLGKHGRADAAREVNLAAARIARQAVPEGVLIAGDMGPTGEMLKPYGAAEPEDVKASYQEQANALVEGGVDLLILETFFDLKEAMLALEAAVATGRPVIASMTYEIKQNDAYTMMGNLATDCAKALTDGGAAVVGANCSVTIDAMVEVAKSLHKGTDAPLILQPNAGKPEVVDGQTIYHETPDHFASLVPSLIENGGRIIGGCCGTSPEFIRKIKEAVG